MIIQGKNLLMAKPGLQPQLLLKADSVLPFEQCCLLQLHPMPAASLKQIDKKD